MKPIIKYLLSIIVMLSFLIVGVEVGKSAVMVTSDDDPNGWICTDTPGECDDNENVTCCTWGPNGCETTACADPGESG